MVAASTDAPPALTGAPAYAAPTYLLPAALIDLCDGDVAQALLLQRFHDWGAGDQWLSANMTDLVRMTHMDPQRIQEAIAAAETAGRLVSKVGMAPTRSYLLVIAA